MSAIGPTINAEVREACIRAVLDRDMKPADVVRLVSTGELQSDLPAQGDAAPKASTVRDWCRKERKRRAGQGARGAAESLPAAERIATLRTRLLNACEHELGRVEREQRKRGDTEPVNPERLRQLARALREAASIPEPTSPERPTPPGQRDPATGEHNGARTRGGMAGAIIADMRTGTTAPPPPPTHDTTTMHSENTTTHHRDDSEQQNGSTAPPTTTNEESSTGERDPVSEARAKVAAALGGLGTLDAREG